MFKKIQKELCHKTMLYYEVGLFTILFPKRPQNRKNTEGGMQSEYARSCFLNPTLLCQSMFQSECGRPLMDSCLNQGSGNYTIHVGAAEKLVNSHERLSKLY